MKNSTTVIAGLAESIFSVDIQFKDYQGCGMGGVYTYLSTDKSVKVGDTVVVDSSSTGLTCVLVVSVSDDYNVSAKGKFIVSKVDTKPYKKAMERLDKVRTHVEELQAKAAKKKQMHQLVEDLGEEGVEELTVLLKTFNN